MASRPAIFDRAKLTGEADITANMAEDILRLAQEREPVCVDDLRREGWTDAQLQSHGFAAVAKAKAMREAQEQRGRAGARAA